MINFNQFPLKDQQKFAARRCIDPVASSTSSTDGWYRINDSCPCSTANSNISGRGFTICPLGINTSQVSAANPTLPLMSILNKYVAIPVKSLPIGSNYPQNQLVPSQFEPRQLMRIGNDFRSAY